MNATDIQGLAPERIATLSAEVTPHLIDAAIALDRAIKADTERLAAYKARLVAIAAARLEAEGQAPADFPGQTVALTSAAGESAKVSFPKPGLARNIFFMPGKPEAYTYTGKTLRALGDVKELAGEAFKKLFLPSYKPHKAFRDLAKALLPKSSAEKLAAMLEEPPGSPRVTFGTES